MNNGPVSTFLRGRRHPSDLIITIALSIIAGLSTQIFQEGSMARILLALPLLLFLPGYSLISMLYPGRCNQKGKSDENNQKPRNLDNVERVVFSIGLSVVLVSLLGLALNYIATITLAPILVSLIGVTVSCSLIAWYLRIQLPDGERFRFSFLLSNKTKEAAYQDRRFAAFLVCCIVLVASLLVYLMANPADNSAYSKFYLLDQYGQLTSLPNNLTVNQTGIIIISIHNLEQETTDYRILAEIDNSTAPLTVINSSATAALSPEARVAVDVTLDHEGLFEKEFAFRFTEPGRYKIVWNLMIDGQETEYQLHFWVNVA
ncbi:MAG: DUF1616 domain-containing protein [Thermoplasmata archaeon]